MLFSEYQDINWLLLRGSLQQAPVDFPAPQAMENRSKSFSFCHAGFEYSFFP
jgi:hypothetical protein